MKMRTPGAAEGTPYAVGPLAGATPVNRSRRHARETTDHCPVAADFVRCFWLQRGRSRVVERARSGGRRAAIVGRIRRLRRAFGRSRSCCVPSHAGSVARRHRRSRAGRCANDSAERCRQFRDLGGSASFGVVVASVLFVAAVAVPGIAVVRTTGHRVGDVGLHRRQGRHARRDRTCARFERQGPGGVERNRGSEASAGRPEASPRTTRGMTADARRGVSRRATKVPAGPFPEGTPG